MPWPWFSDGQRIVRALVALAVEHGALRLPAGCRLYLLTEHTAHVFGVLSYLLLLSCPLMHLFMHQGHGGNHDSGGQYQGRPAVTHDSHAYGFGCW